MFAISSKEFPSLISKKSCYIQNIHQISHYQILLNDGLMRKFSSKKSNEIFRSNMIFSFSYKSDFQIEFLRHHYKKRAMMPSPLEERIKTFYTEDSAGVQKNRRMNGIPVQHKNKEAIVFFYMEGVESVELPPRFQDKIRRLIETRVLDESLIHCDFAETFSDENYRYYEIVEWWTSTRLRQALLKYGKIIRRAMRIKITEKFEKKYEFHVLLDSWT